MDEQLWQFYLVLELFSCYGWCSSFSPITIENGRQYPKIVLYFIIKCM